MFNAIMRDIIHVFLFKSSTYSWFYLFGDARSLRFQHAIFLARMFLYVSLRFILFLVMHNGKGTARPKEPHYTYVTHSSRHAEGEILKVELKKTHSKQFYKSLYYSRTYK